MFTSLVHLKTTFESEYLKENKSILWTRMATILNRLTYKSYTNVFMRNIITYNTHGISKLLPLTFVLTYGRYLWLVIKLSILKHDCIDFFISWLAAFKTWVGGIENEISNVTWILTSLTQAMLKRHVLS